MGNSDYEFYLCRPLRTELSSVFHWPSQSCILLLLFIFFLPFSNKPTVHYRSTSSWRQQCTLSQCDRREPKHERRLRWSKTTSGAVPWWHVAEKSSELPGQLQWPFLLILIVLESSRDSEQVDTKFTKFRSQKNWHVSHVKSKLCN